MENLINAYPLSLKMRISCMEPKCANVFCSSSSERPLAMPPQYTVQLVGLDWLYTSSKVKGLELASFLLEGGFLVAQFVRIDLDPSHWPFIRAMAFSASTFLVKETNP